MHPPATLTPGRPWSLHQTLLQPLKTGTRLGQQPLSRTATATAPATAPGDLRLQEGLEEGPPRPHSESLLHTDEGGARCRRDDGSDPADVADAEGALDDADEDEDEADSGFSSLSSSIGASEAEDDGLPGVDADAEEDEEEDDDDEEEDEEEEAEERGEAGEEENTIYYFPPPAPLDKDGETQVRKFVRYVTLRLVRFLGAIRV